MTDRRGVKPRTVWEQPLIYTAARPRLCPFGPGLGCGWRLARAPQNRGRLSAHDHVLGFGRWADSGSAAGERWGACELAAQRLLQIKLRRRGLPLLRQMAAVRPPRRRVAVEEPPSLWHCPASGTDPDRPQGTAPSSRKRSSRLWHSPGLPLCAASPSRSSCRDDRTPSCRRQARSLASRAAEAWRKPSLAEQLWWPWAWRPVWS